MILESLEISVDLNIVTFKGGDKVRKKFTEILSWLRRHWNIYIEYDLLNVYIRCIMCIDNCKYV